MKNKLKSILLFFVILAGTFTLHAQDDDQKGRPMLTPEQRADKRSEQLKEKLTLSEKQTEQVKALLQQAETARDEEMKKRRDDRKNMEDALARILSPEQMAAYRKLQGEQRSAMQRQRKPPDQE